MKKRGSAVSLNSYGISPPSSGGVPLVVIPFLQQQSSHDEQSLEEEDYDEEVGESEKQALTASSSSVIVSAFSPQRRRTVLSSLQLNTLRSSPPSVLNLDEDALSRSSHSNSRNETPTALKKNNSDRSNSDQSLKPSDVVLLGSTANSSAVQTKAFQLFVGAAGIYGAYLYYGLVQEDLFRYRSPSTGTGFTYVWALQVCESAVTMVIGYFGRRISGGREGLPLSPFFKSGASQLAAKALMSMSLSAGLSFPVVTLAKSAKIVPVMLGQLLMGGSSYSTRDYVFAVLIVVGTSLLSAGGSSNSNTASTPGGSDTLLGLVLIFMSLTADGFTGGLQKKLKRVTASMAPTTYDFLYYSHMAQLLVAVVICVVLGELWTAPKYLFNNPAVWWFVLASCVCSAIGQCFIFYVISCFDPLVCTTITTTRKVLTVILSISFKGHDLTGAGCIGLALACTALLIEVEGQVASYRQRRKGSVESTNKTTQAPSPPQPSNEGKIAAI